MASATQLTKNDGLVLGAILDPEAGLGNGNGNLFIQTGAATVSYYDPQTLRTIRQREKEILLPLNTASPSRTTVQNALFAFDGLLRDFPEYAPGYNNRAQARRLLFTDLEALARHPREVQAVLEDLGTAISLQSPTTPAHGVSEEVAGVLASALTHRGYLLMKASQMKQDGNHVFESVPFLADRDSEQLLEMASQDFASGGRYGNKVAKQLAVHTNPYAKLCGSIVKEALQREIEAYAAGPTEV